MAVIDGYCMGGGLATALSCDIRLASLKSTFAIPAAKLGLAYDVVLSRIQNNSIEFMLGYRFKVDYDRPVKSYKNPRYL